MFDDEDEVGLEGDMMVTDEEAFTQAMIGMIGAQDAPQLGEEASPYAVGYSYGPTEDEMGGYGDFGPGMGMDMSSEMGMEDFSEYPMEEDEDVEATRLDLNSGRLEQQTNTENMQNANSNAAQLERRKQQKLGF